MTSNPTSPTKIAPYRVKRTGKQTRFLAQSVVLEEAGANRLIRIVQLTACAVIVAALSWSAVATVREVANTFGQVVPSGNVRQVQHLEGGIVETILVEVGQVVEKGQVMVQLAEYQAVGDLGTMKSRMVALSLRAERLRAVGMGRSPDFSFVLDGYDLLIEDQRSIYETQMKAHDAGREVLLRQLDQRQDELDVIHEQQKSVRNQIELVKEEVAIRKQLAEEGLGTRIVYLDVQRERARLEGELNGLYSQERAARQRVAEVEERLGDLDISLREAALREMGEVSAELSQVQETLMSLEDRVRRLDIVSPVHGLVQNLTVNNAGVVLPPGGLIGEVVPMDDELQVDVRIATRDVGHVAEGQEVKVKVTSYDFSRFGTVRGELIQISPTTFLDEDQLPYYKGRVRLDEPYVGDPTRPILPGMTVDAGIVTGEKTILAYILKPVYVAFADAFKER